MNHLCNDCLTQVRDHYGKPIPPTTYRVGDKGDKNGMPYTIKAFGATLHRIPGIPPASLAHPRCVHLLVKYRGDKRHAWDQLCIGNTNSFAEPLVVGIFPHRNPAFDYYNGKIEP